MKKLILLVFIPLCFLSSQDDGTTYTLKLLTPNVTEPYLLDVNIFSKDSLDYIRIHFPDEVVLTEYVKDDSTAIKFQAAKINDNKLVTIQFVGYGQLENEVKGKFTSLVDAILRDDMSGTFVLIKK